MSPLSDDRAQWLARCILPHEPALRNWLSRRHLAGLDIDDVVQEAYAKLIQVSSVVSITNPRAYLFQTAKSVIADYSRRRKVVTIADTEIDLSNIASDEPSAEDLVGNRLELHRLAQAIAALPEPTRTVFKLRRVDQMPQRAIAEQMRMPESTVEKHISKAFAALSRTFSRGGNGFAGTSSKNKLSVWNLNAARDGSADR